ncbi:DeoR/GlpR family DNA-binding transcription regulator [Ruminococcaceae bacterium OttesenSCG-928-A16]|nr:DeoR/GlpR family DNA-binding transcription regulator [Ruminococcaceae bacterium OttesenSCG-928-A16]
MAKNSRKNIDQRRTEILEMLAQHGEMKLGQIARDLNVSSMTLRRDIWYMQEQQIVNLASGGRVSLREGTRLDPDIYNRKAQNHLEKIAIAALAATLVSDGEVIGLDASTSALELSYHLQGKKNLTVVTNNLLIPPILSTNPTINIISAGGAVRSKALSTVGEIAEHTIREFLYDKVFISANALHATNGLSDTDMDEIQTKKAFIENTQQLVVLADSSKLGKNALQKCCATERINTLVTDSNAEKQQISAFTNVGVSLKVADL